MNTRPINENTATFFPVLDVDHRPRFARRIGRIVRRFDDIRLLIQDVDDILFAVDMITERNTIDSRCNQLAIDAGRYPGSTIRVLAIRDYQVEGFVASNSRQSVQYDIDTRFAHDVADKQDSHLDYFHSNLRSGRA